MYSSELSELQLSGWVSYLDAINPIIAHAKLDNHLTTPIISNLQYSLHLIATMITASEVAQEDIEQVLKPAEDINLP